MITFNYQEDSVNPGPKPENVNPGKRLQRKNCFESIIGNSEKMQKVFEIIEETANTNATILILGEKGTEKDSVAKEIHQASYRREEQFVAVNCADLTGKLLEIELFGYEKGASGNGNGNGNGNGTRIGLFELANGGTIFLDEIEFMTPTLQARLLRILGEGQFDRVGGNETIETDVRVIGGSQQSLKTAVQEGRFREDLFEQLNVIQIEIPPLRERKSDLSLLARHFLDRYNGIKKKKIKGISSEAMSRLKEYDWPGNVRELRHTIKHLIDLSHHDIIRLQDLPEKFQAFPETEHRSLGEYLRRRYAPVHTYA